MYELTYIHLTINAFFVNKEIMILQNREDFKIINNVHPPI